MAGEHTLAEPTLKVTHHDAHLHPNQCPHQVSTFYIAWNPRNSLDKILKLMVTTTRSKVKSRSHHDVAYLQPLSNVPTKYQLPALYSFRDIARQKFKGQGHYGKIKGHTYNSQAMSLPSINCLHLTVSEI